MARYSDADVENFMWRFKLLIGGIVALVVLPLVGYAVYMDQRLDAFEQSLRYQPPESDEPEVDAEVALVTANPVQGQIVYVPAYSHIYHEDGSPYLLTITLSVRNTSLDHEIVVKSVRYFDSAGKEVKGYLTKPLRLAPLASTEFLIERDDTSGGSGANFLVEWVAGQPVTEPIIEAVMIDTTGQQGISFARSGTVVRQLPE